MKSVGLLTPEGMKPLEDFTKASAASTNARTRKPVSKTIPLKIRWVMQIAGDGTLTALAVRTAILLADYYDEQEGCAWPSQIRLAARLNASRGGVRQAIKRLEEAGYIEFVSTRGRKRNTRYFLHCPAPENGY